LIVLTKQNADPEMHHRAHALIEGNGELLSKTILD